MKTKGILGLTTVLALLMIGSVQAQTYPPSLVSYWNFDESNAGTALAVDQISTNDGGFTGGSVRTDGLIGVGAARFTNADGQSVNVGTTGAGNNYTVVDGITVEALFQSNWDGTGFDHIFRKDDGASRILLSFQAGPVLAFGLGVGGVYSELDMPLDGASGRPTLAELTDGNTHHVVARYEVSTGIKAIYIDGVLVHMESLGAGSAISTGGGSPARIGSGHSAGLAKDAFNGVIDEVAFYNDALSASVIAAHYNQVLLDMNYFSAAPVVPVEAVKDALRISGDQIIQTTVGSKIREKIRGGVPPYTLFSATKQPMPKAKVTLNGSHLRINPFAIGTTIVSVLDSVGDISSIVIIARAADPVASALSIPAATAIDSTGNSTTAQISGGVVNSDGFVSLDNAVVTAGEEFEIIAVVYPQIDQIGEEAGIIVALVDTANPETILMLKSNGKHSIFHGSSVPYFSQIILEESNVVDITAGNSLALTLDELGLYNIYVGYQLLSGEAIFYNGDPIVLDIVQ